MLALRNPRHEAFAQALARGMSASAAYVEAGYKANRHNAAALAREQHIGTRVAELQEEQLAIHQQATAAAAANKQVDFIAGNSTDGLIDALGLVVLEDDKHYFPPYDAVPLIRDATIAKHPEIRDALRALGGKISEEQMRRMNYAVDGEHKDVKDVVREFLMSM